MACSKHEALEKMGMDVFRRAQPSPDSENEGFVDETLNMQPNASSISSWTGSYGEGSMP